MKSRNYPLFLIMDAAGWRRVAADNALRTLGGQHTSFGPLERKLLRKLEFVGMPPRAMRAFARVVVFPSFGHARFVFAVVVYSI